MKRHTALRSLNYIKRLYQKELDNIYQFMTENGLMLSDEKSHMMLFNSGYDPDVLPSFKLRDAVIKYKQTVKFLGVFLTSKLTWNCHIKYFLTKARKTLNPVNTT